MGHKGYTPIGAKMIMCDLARWKGANVVEMEKCRQILKNKGNIVKWI
jgi:hypothetical protein